MASHVTPKIKLKKAQKRKEERFLLQNLQILQQRGSSDPMAIRGYLAQHGRLQLVEVSPARNLDMTLRIVDQNKSMHIHSAYDPRAEAREWVDHISTDEWQVGVIFGFGLGYHVEELNKRFPERDLIIIEPCTDVLLAALDGRGLSHILSNPNFTIISNHELIEVSVQVSAVLHKKIRKGHVVFLSWPPYQRFQADVWGKLQQQLANELVQATTNLVTGRIFNLLPTQNAIQNLVPAITDPGVNTLYPLLADRPAILVSAGPSLDKNVDQLRLAKGKALIIAVGSAVRVLNRYGIEPDCVASYDPSEVNYNKIFKDLDTERMILFYAARIYADIVSAHKGPRFVTTTDSETVSQWFLNHLDMNKDIVLTGPSIANVTWDLLRRAGSDPIIFVGQDLAYSDYKQYAAGVDHGHTFSSSEIAEINKNKDLFWVDGVSGGKVLTNNGFLSMKTWFEQRIALLGKGGTYINATEGGAKIAGTLEMSLAEAIDRYCIDFFWPYERMLEIHEEESQTLAALNWQECITGVLSTLPEQLNALDRQASEALKSLRRLLIDHENGSLTGKQFSKIWSVLQRTLRTVDQNEIYQVFIRPTMRHQEQALQAFYIGAASNVTTNTVPDNLVDLASAAASHLGMLQRIGEEIERLMKDVHIV